MSAITQYILPFGAFEHTDADPQGSYSRVCDPATAKIEVIENLNYRADILDENPDLEGYIKFDFHEGIFIFDKIKNRYHTMILDPVQAKAFFRVVSDYAKIPEFPKDVLELRFDFADFVLIVNPHQYNKHDRLNTAKIYVPDRDITFGFDSQLWKWIMDFATVMATASSYMFEYGEKKINLS
jgi:hypothetical protein